MLANQLSGCRLITRTSRSLCTMVHIPLLSSTLPVNVSQFSQYPVTGQVYISENAGSDILCDASCLRRGHKTAITFIFYLSAGVKRSLATYSVMRDLLTIFLL